VALVAQRHQGELTRSARDRADSAISLKLAAR
jgi:hypothetical protein